MSSPKAPHPEAEKVATEIVKAIDHEPESWEMGINQAIATVAQAITPIIAAKKAAKREADKWAKRANDECGLRLEAQSTIARLEAELATARRCLARMVRVVERGADRTRITRKADVVTIETPAWHAILNAAHASASSTEEGQTDV